MTYLSVCSGIEAVPVAWEPLGFKPVELSDIGYIYSCLICYDDHVLKNEGQDNDLLSGEIEEK